MSIPQDDEYGWQQYALAGLSNAATGAVGGSAFGPAGAVIGGAAGLGVGLYDAYKTQQAMGASAAQQAALQKELDNAGRDIGLYTQQAALQGGLERERAQSEAAYAANRGGMNPYETAALQSQIGSDVALQSLAAQAPLIQAAQQATMMERQQILGEYQTAQGLADNALYDHGVANAFGQAAGLAGQLGQMQKPLTDKQFDMPVGEKPSNSLKEALPEQGVPVPSTALAYADSLKRGGGGAPAYTPDSGLDLGGDIGFPGYLSAPVPDQKTLENAVVQQLAPEPIPEPIPQGQLQGAGNMLSGQPVFDNAAPPFASIDGGAPPPPLKPYQELDPGYSYTTQPGEWVGPPGINLSYRDTNTGASDQMSVSGPQLRFDSPEYGQRLLQNGVPAPVVDLLMKAATGDSNSIDEILNNLEGGN